jgi:hypothetical protein
MRGQCLVAGLLLSLVTGPALAKSRPVTEEEKAKLLAALTAEGCSGGDMEFDDDGYFEVDDATCADGRKYDLKFDPSFKLIKKKLD